MQLGRVAQAIAWLSYPLLIYFGMQLLQPRYVAILLGLIMVLRWRTQMQSFLAGLTRLDLAVLLALLLLSLATSVTNSELLLRFYPAAMAFGSFCLFFLSLFRPPTMIERFARLDLTDEPSPRLVAYTRRVTQAWCLFLAANTSVALFTALYCSREAWALFNGFIIYILMGAMFGGEWLLRKFVFKIPAA